MRAGPLRQYTPPSYGTREHVLGDAGLRCIAVPRRLFTRPLGRALGVLVASSSAVGCIGTVSFNVPALTEAEALQIIEERFGYYGVGFDHPADPSAAGLPFIPDLFNASLGLVVDYSEDVYDSPHSTIAGVLLDQGDELCGVSDTGAPDRTRELLAGVCEDRLAEQRTNPPTYALEACLRYACFDLHALGLYSQGSEWSTEPYLDQQVNLFVLQLYERGVLGSSG
jgi:hypothetical protein